MANPRQRRKTRSSSYRPVSQSKNAKRNLKKTPPIRGPKLLQQAWDKHKTVRQNYAALGLIHDLNSTESGGTETSNVNQPTASSVSDSFETMPLTSNSFIARSIPRGYGKIIRDEQGNIVDVQLAEEPEVEEANVIVEGDVDMEQMSPELDANAREKWVTDLGGKSARSMGADSAVVKDLERLSALKDTSGTTLSASITGAGARYASEGEIAYLSRLVEKYGTDVERMARDRKINSSQRTAGELRRGLGRAGMLA
ncbi:hypothetical protein K435DRAFT_642733 [Dendrothele bispora CBS 962.96]|uniref:Nucleolar protein 16 n=1 Tax=Dendrothele bispora (strain CBS 962.96) TaxID=1314807 RepID=A0A4S8MYT1_DENBC|nr:hypothetical protein K435DRAFT_642733 [Dendrothele bispora CBS 962.96]